jgi:MoxR-like ATPase
MVGKTEAIELLTLTLLCKGHVLIEDVPGTGKTTLAIALAKSIGGSYNRISCTPDVMPSDITGFTMYHPKKEVFEYHEGAVMTNVFLADEINRTPPKTQSGLLEAMEERHVTVDGKHHKLPEPFIVIATQNPIEYLGTYPLPEAQLDRFMVKMAIGYPDTEEEMLVMERFKQHNPLDYLQAVITLEELKEIQEEILSVKVHPDISRYIINLVKATRDSKDTLLGISPRGTLFISKMAKGVAYYRGRSYVIPDDVKQIFKAVGAHRLVPKPEAKYENISNEVIIDNVMKLIRIPEGDSFA